MNKNPKDILTSIYTVEPTESRNTIFWCRRNLGERNDGWDFNGGYSKVTIYIWNSRLKVMYDIFKA